MTETSGVNADGKKGIIIMQAISSVCFTIAALQVLAMPILLVIWFVRKITKKPKMKWLKWFWLSFAAFVVIGGLTNPQTWCKHEYELIESKDASCEESGYEISCCHLCGKEQKSTFKKLGHDMNEIRRVNPTYKKDGEIVNKCSRCGYEEIDILEKLKSPTESKITEPETQSTEPSETVDLSVTYDDIYLAYKENELVANDLYRYNRYRITAKINGMATGGLLNLTGGATLTMETRVGNTIVFFYAEFEKEQEEALKQVKVGDTITFDGKCVGKGGFVDCEITGGGG